MHDVIYSAVGAMTIREVEIDSSRKQFTIMGKTLRCRSCLRVREWHESHGRNLWMLFDLTSPAHYIWIRWFIKRSRRFHFRDFRNEHLYLNHGFDVASPILPVRFLYYATHRAPVSCAIITLMRFSRFTGGEGGENSRKAVLKATFLSPAVFLVEGPEDRY